MQKIEAGIQRLEQDVADHWYTKAHGADVPVGVKQTDADAQAEADNAELAKMADEEKAAAKSASDAAIISDNAKK
jgi:hypothetical protein